VHLITSQSTKLWYILDLHILYYFSFSFCKRKRDFKHDKFTNTITDKNGIDWKEKVFGDGTKKPTQSASINGTEIS